jgi:hypothetical protein
METTTIDKEIREQQRSDQRQDIWRHKSESDCLRKLEIIQKFVEIIALRTPQSEMAIGSARVNCANLEHVVMTLDPKFSGEAR